jgi:hypothetical protein
MAFQSLMSSMWEQHKKAFGAATRSNEWECALCVSYLTEHVLEHFEPLKEN